MLKNNFKIGFIGAGKVGTAFGVYLKQNGFTIHGYYSRTLNSTNRAAILTNSKVEKTLSGLVGHTDIIFITTNDDEIERVCNTLVNQDLLSEGKIMVHMSGASSSNILQLAKQKGCYIYSLHPIQSFADINKAVEDLDHTVFSIEGDDEKIEIIESILNRMGNKYFRITAEQKAIYHATACVMSNYLVTLMDYGLSLFESIGIDKQEGYKALLPLIEGTIKNIDVLGTEKALTGPIARGDSETVKMHIKALREYQPEKLEFYRLMGMLTIELAEKSQISDTRKSNGMKNVFKETFIK